MNDAVTPALQSEPDNDNRVHDPIGAYILGSLSHPETVAFEAHLRECEQCQRELYALGPLVAMLPRLYDDLDLAGGTIGPDANGNDHDQADAVASEIDMSQDVAISEPPAVEETGDSVAAPVSEPAEPVHSDATGPAIEPSTASSEAASEAVAPPTKQRRRPRGRIAPGEAPPEAAIVSVPSERRSLVPWAIAAGCAILAVGAILWALAMMGQIDELKSERNLQDDLLAQLNQEREEYLAQTPALIHALVPTTAGSIDTSGTVFLDPDPAGGGGVVTFEGLAQPPSGQVYQVWTIIGDKLTPGPTFVPGADGKAMVQIGNDAAAAEQMVISIEPTGGSDTPTTSPILQGHLH